MENLEAELRKELKSAEMQAIIGSATSPISQEEVETDILRQSQEILLELSEVDEALSGATAALDRTRLAISKRTDGDAREIALGCLTILTIGSALFALSGYVFSWDFVNEILGTWSSPFWSGWPAAIYWAIVLISVFGFAYQADFALRRRRRAIKLVEAEEGLESALLLREQAEDQRKDRLRGILRDFVTEISNRGISPQYGEHIAVRPPSSDTSPTRNLTVGIGLSEVTTRGVEIPTVAKSQLLRIFDTTPGGSIGISGPRGVGKSTLLTSVCGPNLNVKDQIALTVLTSAPVEYEGREFLLHLFSSLCKSVLQRERIDGDSLDSDAISSSLIWQQRSLKSVLRPMATYFLATAALLMLVAVVIASSGATQDVNVQGATSANSGSPRLNLGLQPGPFAMLGVALLVLGAVLLIPWHRLRWTSRTYRRSELDVEHAGIAKQARNEIRHIRFQRSYTSGWSGGLKVMPAGFDLTSNAALNLSQKPESLPELVDRFRRFAGIATVTYGHLVIGIDELDKLKSAQEGESFLNGIKSIFGIPNCFYLVSVSEHALSTFERRGLGFRDAFDSALDDVIRVDPLDVVQSRALLNRRILRFPDTFAQLCYMLSGGLPRDLIRVARHIIEMAAAAPNGFLSLRDASEQATAREIAAKVRATSVALSSVKESTKHSEVLVAISRLPQIERHADLARTLSELSSTLAALENPTVTDELRQFVALCMELVVYVELLTEIRKIVGIMSTRGGWERANALRLSDQLASARQALETSLPLAQARLRELQKNVREAGQAAQRDINSLGRPPSSPVSPP